MCMGEGAEKGSLFLVLPRAILNHPINRRPCLALGQPLELSGVLPQPSTQT